MRRLEAEMNAELAGKVAVVTGANRGIGLGTAQRLAELGLRVVLSGRDSTACERAAREIRAQSAGQGEVASMKLDVADPDSVAGFREAVERQVGGVDILVNNAAVFLDKGMSVFEVDDSAIRKTMEVNLHGPLRLCRALVPGMVERGWGRVVNISSGYGSLAGMGGRNAAYKLSKAALNALTRIVAGEIQGDVKVNSADPGWVRTRMGGPAALREVDEAVKGIIWLATLPSDGPNGGFFLDGKPKPW